MTQFQGLKVLELASVLAGPSVGQFFAELGAEVIKIENLRTKGDVTRSWKVSGEKTDDRSAYFCSVNWGKKSLAVDLTTREGRNIVQTLASKSDIVIASYKPGDAEKLEVDYQTLSKKNPGLIYGQVTGYGSGNPRVGYDAIIQAEAGFMFMNGEPGGPSLKIPVALMDVLAGHHLKEGLLLAMLEKNVTGKGRLVEVSLIQAAISSLVNQATNWLVANRMPQKQGSAHPNIAPYGDVFRMADGKELILAIGTDNQFKNLCRILELPGVSDNVKFSTNPSRVENRKELNQLLNEKIRLRESREFKSLLDKENIPAGVIQNMADVFTTKEASDLVLKRDDIKGLRTLAIASNYESKIFDDSGAPHLGEHTRKLLVDAGWDEREIEKLITKKVINP